MLRVRICRDLDEGQQLWEQYWPREQIFDLWAVRTCFQKAFNHSPYFLVADRNGRVEGLLALSWIEDERCFGHFPGETWQGKTWLEQNRILAQDASAFRALFDQIPEAVHIRYLTRESASLNGESPEVDETGYLFAPKQYDYSYETYWQRFSGKSRKKLRRELLRLEALGLSYRHDCLPDIDRMFQLNLETFGEDSYFSDARFRESFENLIAWLQANDMLRVTSVVLGGKVAAVDVGVVWNSSFTVLAGGTHADFPGVAKLINFHHLQWACLQRLRSVDFLCGDFQWKERFHLTPRPLYKIQARAIHVRTERASICAA